MPKRIARSIIPAITLVALCSVAITLDVGAAERVLIGLRSISQPTPGPGIPQDDPPRQLSGFDVEPTVTPEGELVSTWNFGLRITATGPTANLTATFPVPRDWPEQSVEMLRQQRSPNVNDLGFRDLDELVRQATVRINRMAAGETAEVVIEMRVVKRPEVHTQASIEGLRIPPRGDRALAPFLRPSPHIESNHPRIRQLAQQLRRDDGDGWQQAHDVYQWVRDNVQYEFDPDIRSTIEALNSGQGDCEELSSVFIAICRALGIPARAVWIPEHTYPEFYLVDEEGQGTWYPCQAAGDYAFGEMYEWRPILQKGDSFRLPGYRQLQRYVQPTVIGTHDATTPPRVEWIMAPIQE